MGEIVRVRLRPKRDKALRQGHPWLFSGAIAAEEGPRDASLAAVEDAAGRALGIGFYNPRSQIRVRMVRSDEGPVDQAFFARRIDEAMTLRRGVVPPETSGYRLLNAEGDGLPGWIVDRYGDVLMSQITAAGLEGLRDEAYAALAERFPEAVIVQQNGLMPRRHEGLPADDELIRGTPPAEILFTESGLEFTAEPGGQKTGFYFDQRSNRRLVERLAGGRRMLDLFAHSGATCAYALRGGATSALALESAQRLVERGREHLARNGLGERAEWVCGNVFHELRERDGEYDLVVCDPPPLVRRRADLDAGSRAYKDLNRLALARVASGGFFLTFTCSATVDGKLFRQILFAAAQEAGVRMSLLRPLGAGGDHPVAITHPQGEYLKGWLAVVFR